MPKLPALPLDTERWLGSIRRAALPLEMQGAYMNLLARCWAGVECSLPSSIAELRAASGGLQYGLETLIAEFFIPHPNLPNRITNETLRNKWLRTQAVRRSAAKSIASRWSKAEVSDSNGLHTNVSKSAKQTELNDSEGLNTNVLRTYARPSSKPKELVLKYQGPDRQGNLRTLVAGFTHIHMSQPEREKMLARFKEAGLRLEFHHKAVELVDIWFDEHPLELRKSSDHLSRITRWGIIEALKFQDALDKSKRVGQPFAGREEPRTHPPRFTPRVVEKRATAADIPAATRELLDNLLRKPSD